MKKTREQKHLTLYWSGAAGRVSKAALTARMIRRAAAPALAPAQDQRLRPSLDLSWMARVAEVEAVIRQGSHSRAGRQPATRSVSHGRRRPPAAACGRAGPPVGAGRWARNGGLCQYDVWISTGRLRSWIFFIFNFTFSIFYFLFYVFAN
jgi:hypothetical protein